jgi:3-polyprenyl-4-hydroxybenzoate decarboxylase
MMFLKSMVVVDPDQYPKDLEALLDAMNNNVHIATDIIVLDGMVADSLEAASPYENVHSKILIDATTLTERDPRSSNEPLEGSYKQEVPAWRQGLEEPPAFDNIDAVHALKDVTDARMLRGSILVVTTNIPESPSPRDGSSTSNDDAESARREKILLLRNQIWQLENSTNLRWLFITNDDLDLHCEKARRRLLWQLTSRFDVGRGLTFDEDKERMCWDATTPIPSSEHGVRRWPAITMHSDETLEAIRKHPELDKYQWPAHLEFR